MKINTNKVFFKFKPKCAKCEHYNIHMAGNRFAVYEFIIMGWLICSECGENLKIKPECKISK